MPSKKQRVHATASWWKALTTQQKKAYIRQHPNSRYASSTLGKGKRVIPMKAKSKLFTKPRTVSQMRTAIHLSPKDLTNGPLRRGR